MHINSQNIFGCICHDFHYGILLKLLNFRPICTTYLHRLCWKYKTTVLPPTKKAFTIKFGSAATKLIRNQLFKKVFVKYPYRRAKSSTNNFRHIEILAQYILLGPIANTSPVQSKHRPAVQTRNSFFLTWLKFSREILWSRVYLARVNCYVTTLNAKTRETWKNLQNSTISCKSFQVQLFGNNPPAKIFVLFFLGERNFFAAFGAKL